MATEPKAAAENVKIDLFEDDDEFEINEGVQHIYSISVLICEIAIYD